MCICRIIDLVLDMNYSGLIIAVITFVVIGLFHPLVVKGEYYFGTRIWWLFAIAGVCFIIASLLVTNDILSPVLGVTPVPMPSLIAMRNFPSSILIIE